MSYRNRRSAKQKAPILGLIAIAVTLSPFAVMADIKSNARLALEMWSPSAIDFSDGTLIVNLPQDRVTEDMYIAALSFGLCLGTLGGRDFSSVSEFVLLNQLGTQGFVYERGATDCDAILDEELRSIKDQRLHILGATHWY